MSNKTPKYATNEAERILKQAQFDALDRDEQDKAITKSKAVQRLVGASSALVGAKKGGPEMPDKPSWMFAKVALYLVAYSGSTKISVMALGTPPCHDWVSVDFWSTSQHNCSKASTNDSAPGQPPAKRNALAVLMEASIRLANAVAAMP